MSLEHVCSVCGKINTYGHCDDCYERYQEDIRTGHIPPRFIEAGISFEFSDWIYVKETEQYYFCDGPETARLRVDMACKDRIKYRTSQPQTEAQRKKAADDRIKKYSTY